MPECTTNMDEARQRLLGLLEYIQQVEKLKKQAPFTVPDEYFRVFQEEVQGLPGLEFNVISRGDDLWLRVARLQETPPPELSQPLVPWVTLSKSPEKPPELKPEIRGMENDTPRVIKLEEASGISSLFDAYVAERWQPWTMAERPRRKTIALYNKLFALQQAMAIEGAETPIELVWGMGVALWKKDGARTNVKHPLLTQSCEVSLNQQTFELEVRPRSTDCALEIDCYSELEIAGVTQLQEFWRQQQSTAESRPSPFEAASTHPTLKAAVGWLDPAGRFIECAAAPTLPAVTDKLTISDTWVLYARRRSGQVLLEDIERLRKHLKTRSEALPKVLTSFVMPGDTEVRQRPSVHFRGLSSSSSEPGTRELYFPMPYNAEQVAIVEKLEANDGVVVQGPPGTGKTHTIANVICHFLAQGKRVLVTSYGETALSVLQEKIPQEVRALSVALLANERDGMKQFEHSIQTIATKVADLNSGQVERRIAAHEARLAELHQKVAALDHEVKLLAEKQLGRVRFSDRDVTPEDLARLVIEREPEHVWLSDPLDPEKHESLSFTNEDIAALRAARTKLQSDLGYLPHELPAADSLPTEATLIAIHRDLVRAHGIETRVESGDILPLVDTTPGTFEEAQGLLALIRRLDASLVSIRASGMSGSSALRTRLAASQDAITQALVDLSRSIVEEDEARSALLTRPVEAPADAELDVEVLEGLVRLAQGKSAFALPFGKKQARAALAGVMVAGLKPASVEDWQAVETELRHRLTVRQLIARWNAAAAECGLATVTGAKEDGFRRLALNARQVLALRVVATDLDPAVRTGIVHVFGHSVDAGLPKEETARLAHLTESLTQHLDRGRLAYAMSQVNDVLRKLEDCEGPVVGDLRRLLARDLGNAATDEIALAERWRSLLTELRRLASLRPTLVTVERIAGLVEAAGAPQWAMRLRSEPVAGESDPLTPAQWLEAWRWRVAKSLLDGLDGHDKLRTLFAKRKEAEQDLARTYRELVSDRTWLGVYNNSPESVRRALQEYLNSMQAIGSGRGVRAIRHRTTARQAMLKAHPAVPCWIMPQWRVSETLPPEAGAFDLVVIDEASQSDIWALPALIRGKKILVVGDHKQVSPSAVGMAEQKIKELAERYLKDQPNGSQMTPDRSIYDLARVVFAGNSVMLKEHFRCVPAIIEYSNREFYLGDIRPLRIPRRSERLDPPLIDVFTKGGYRRGDVNDPEARAIVAEIETILADPSMDGRTIGVVTLLGHEQAALIESLIHKSIPTDEIVGRKILAGAPPVFQGSERDIILLSLVIAKGDRGMASKLESEQRFNVAASRARDRMMLFRSVEESDVNPDSLTGKLLQHFRQPFRQDAQKVVQLRELCESNFEREVFDLLVQRGFRTRPQMKVGEYRIDLVVEGAEDRRLAIECDGDRYHGPERWSDDMARQRVLERAGWIFWRCFASSFVLRREQVLDDLFSTLARMGIDPLGSESVDNTPWVATRVIDPCQSAEEENEEATEISSTDTIPPSDPLQNDRRELPLRSEARGYQWKNLFLPDGTQMRMPYKGTHYFAKVEGDEIIYEGTSISPSSLANMITSSSRNAWRDFWIKRPGDPDWSLADDLRQSSTK